MCFLGFKKAAFYKTYLVRRFNLFIKWWILILILQTYPDTIKNIYLILKRCLTLGQDFVTRSKAASFLLSLLKPSIDKVEKKCFSRHWIRERAGRAVLEVEMFRKGHYISSYCLVIVLTVIGMNLYSMFYESGNEKVIICQDFQKSDRGINIWKHEHSKLFFILDSDILPNTNRPSRTNHNSGSTQSKNASRNSQTPKSQLAENINHSFLVISCLSWRFGKITFGKLTSSLQIKSSNLLGNI